MAITYAAIVGADPQTICEAAYWVNTCTFTRFYQFDTSTNSDAKFGKRVLMLAGASTLAHAGGEGIA